MSGVGSGSLHAPNNNNKNVEMVEKINDSSCANYTLTKFFLLHLIAESLRTTEIGREFLRNPSKFVLQDSGLDVLDGCIRHMLSDLITDLNGELLERERAGTPFDFKRELKSLAALSTLTKVVVGSYQKLVGRNRVESFDDEWVRVSSERASDTS